jgi:hypothetical protein
MKIPFKMNGFSGFGNSPLRDGEKTKGKLKTIIGEKLKNINHPVIPPTPEQSKKAKGQPLGYLGEYAWKNRPTTFSPADIANRKRLLKGNKQKIKKFFGL